jgi:hypothetical protein
MPSSSADRPSIHRRYLPSKSAMLARIGGITPAMKLKLAREVQKSGRLKLG